MTLEQLYEVFLLLGGIGLFLYGINFMSASLQQAAGDNLRVVLQKVTKNGFLALLVGTLVTALIQSSGATSVMVVGFVNAGLMNLIQGTFVMLGANIGTTITAQIIAFKIENFAPLILFIGMLMYLFIKKKIVKKIGGVVLGFGLLFVGIYLMGTAAKSEVLHLDTIIQSFIDNFSNPLLLLLFGIVFTAIIQSSSASIGILQVLVSTIAACTLSLDQFFMIILGMNIGAASPVVFVSFSGDRSSKRAALSLVVTKFLGVFIFLAFWYIIPPLKTFVLSTSSDLSRQIANLHLIFNIISSFTLCPFVKPIAKFIEKILPDRTADELNSKKLVYLHNESALNPGIAVTQVKREVVRMGNIAYNNIHLALDSFFKGDASTYDSIMESEELINFLNHEITGWLVRLHSATLSEKEMEEVGMMFHVVADIERIGDHADNISEYTQAVQSNKENFSEEAHHQLEEISSSALKSIRMALDIYEGNKFDMLPEISDLEEKIDTMQDKFIEDHIERLKNDKCNSRGGVIFTDMVSDLERCSDHAINIAYAIEGEKTTVVMKKAYVIRDNQL